MNVLEGYKTRNRRRSQESTLSKCERSCRNSSGRNNPDSTLALATRVSDLEPFYFNCYLHTKIPAQEHLGRPSFSYVNSPFGQDRESIWAWKNVSPTGKRDSPEKIKALSPGCGGTCLPYCRVRTWCVFFFNSPASVLRHHYFSSKPCVSTPGQHTPILQEQSGMCEQPRILEKEKNKLKE